jgi:hypothetical protein
MPPDAPEETSPTRRFESTAISVDVLARVRRLAIGLCAIAALVLIPLVRFQLSPLGLGLVAGTLALWVITVFLPRLRWIGPGPGLLAVEDDAIVVRVDRPRRAPSERRILLAAIKAGYRTDDEVRLETHARDVVAIAIDRAETGEAILHALGHDARRRVLEVPIASIASRWRGLTFFVWLSLLSQLPGALAFWLAAVFLLLGGQGWETTLFMLGGALLETSLFALGARLVRQRVVAIGTDGIVYRQLLRKRFHPYSSIVDVGSMPGGVYVTLRSGKQLRLRTRSAWGSGVDPIAQALRERIQTARSAARSATDVQTKLPLLERRGRPAQEWRDDLAALVGKSGYRIGAVTVADLRAVIEDTTLSPEHRIGASLALAASDPAEARARARIAAASCADHDLQAALEHAAEGEIDDAGLSRFTR